jgi:hypothetical protein
VSWQFSPARESKNSLSGNAQKLGIYGSVDEKLWFLRIHGLIPSIDEFGLYRPIKNIRFMAAERERNEALSIPEAERSHRARKRARREFRLRAAQSCTSGIDRRSRLKL